MQSVLLATAAALALAAMPAAPADAQSRGGQGFTDNDGARSAHRSGRPRIDRRFQHDPGWIRERDDRRRHRDFGGDVLVGGWGYDGWGWYNDRTFAPDSFNDWWHERPWRSYPRWVTTGSCDRIWWGGGQWRCQW